MESRIIEDKREIAGIFYDDDEQSCWTKDSGFIITAYGEPREFCLVAFFEVKNQKGDTVARVPATKVTVTYV